MNTDSTSPDAGRNRERQPSELDLFSDVALLCIQYNPPGLAIMASEETLVFAHPVPGEEPCFYVCYRSGPSGKPDVFPLADRNEAAAFIIGMTDMNLQGATDEESQRIREYFPDFFGSGDG
ncbi:MAG: hypothetical protein M0R30_04975 [Methanoregula sp.]|uniref:hypothetical protein n=1 Tax=Methanoregula sp. TaxID=2052170 RepID=UPI0025F1BC80|nr:hypothetical protein [Methanoregula sp.]MCK9630975.1 hypothetical protein [Methanoregula sp.]